MAAGDFTNSALLDVTLKAESMWSTGTQANVYKANAEAARAVLENQSATFTELNDPEKDRKVRINWLNPCGVEAEDCDPDCEIIAPELETGVENYEFDICKEAKFSIDLEKLRTSVYSKEEVAAKGQAKAIKALDEFWAAQVLIKLKAFSGINVAPEPWTFNAAGMTTNVPTADWTLKMVAPLMKQAVLNQMTAPYYIEKGDLYVPFTNAKLDSGNGEGKGDAARVSAWNMYFDMFNFQKAGITEDMFAVDASAVAMKTYNRYGNTPEYHDSKIGEWRYSVASQLLPGVRYDVEMQKICVVEGGKKRDKYAWRFITNGLVALNPEGCPVTISAVTYNPTGVLSYSKV